jgi:hypothetical protein
VLVAAYLMASVVLALYLVGYAGEVGGFHTRVGVDAVRAGGHVQHGVAVLVLHFMAPVVTRVSLVASAVNANHALQSPCNKGHISPGNKNSELEIKEW